MNKRRMISVTGIAVMLATVFFACKEEVPVAGVKLDKTALTLTADETAEITATVEPADAAVQTVSWSVEPEGVVELNFEGNICTVIPVENGTATVTASAGAAKAVCTIDSHVFIGNTAFVKAVGDACSWTPESDGRVKLTAENLEKIRAVTSLDISYWNLTDLSGIEYFTGLTVLFCYTNQLTELDVSGCTALTKLDCYNNQLTELDVSGCTALTKLDCHDNQLTELDVSANTALEMLQCDSNQLTELDVSSNTKLGSLDCYNNQLTELDVSANTELMGLQCCNNQLTELDVSANTALAVLLCYNNQLTELVVSANTELRDLQCGMQTSDGTTAQTLTLTLNEDQKTMWEFWESDTCNADVSASVAQ